MDKFKINSKLSIIIVHCGDREHLSAAQNVQLFHDFPSIRVPLIIFGDILAFNRIRIRFSECSRLAHKRAYIHLEANIVFS